jgi:hypothetical protein
MNGTSVVNERTWRWEAEGPSIGHNTGRLESDGWLCQSGIDAPNQHMIYGPYDQTVTAGQNTAEFRMKIDNNTANNDVVADIDVRNSTTGATLAFQSVTRQQFSVAGNYTSFKLPFVMPADNQTIELRVHWKGGAYLKVDYVGVQQNNVTPENYLFASLKGLVNKTKPRIFSYEGDNFAEGPHTWMQSLGLTWTEHLDKWNLITKYRSEISGLIVYDPAQPHTVNLATMLAKDKKALIASPSLLARLTSAPYNIPVLIDLRGQFSSKLQVYQTMYNSYWPSLDKRLLIGLSPDAHQAAVREYACALGAAVIWLDPMVAGESELLNSFLSSMPAGANYMGWWPEEGAGITRASQYGISTIASDYACNLTVHSGMPRTVNVKPIPAKPALQNKIYVAFILSDGDNLQYVEHLMRKLWNNPDRGSVPIGWTVSPAMLDAMPGALNYYHQTSTNNDNLISGPSGYGYTYPNSFPNQASLDQFVAKTEDYNRRSGLRVVTIWNTITGGINANVGQSFAANAPTTLGLTGQNTGGPLSIYNNSLPGMPLSCNYCTGEQAMKDHIASASAGWNGAEPRFIIIQAQPWTDVKPSNFKNVANSLNANYSVVRPDHLFMLMRESKGLPIDPAPASTTGLVTAYKDCNYTGFSTGLDVGDYNLTQLRAKGFLDNDLSSLKITQGYKAVLFDGDNFTGASTEITSDLGCSTEWNDKTTSIRIRTNGDPTINGVYFLRNRHSGLDMDVWGLSNDDGANISQGISNGGLNQQFRFEHLGDGTYKVIAVHSGKVMDVDGIKKDNGANVQQWTYFGSANQQFIAVPSGDGHYKLIAKHSGKVVEVAGASTTNGANVQQWDNNNQTCGQWKFVPVTTLNGNGDGLTGNYFNGMNFETAVYSRKDATLNIDWGDGTPNSAVNADRFSARWTGQIQPRYTGEYTFYINSDNGRRVWINNTLIIDQWADNWGTDFTGKITLTAQQKYDIKVEYFENVGGANIKFEWSSAQQTREVVPQTQLYSNSNPSVSITSPINNASFNSPATITINANASDADGTISKVEFFNGSTPIGSDLSSPYSFVWNNVAAGTYTITTKATDNLNAITTSSVVTVVVNNVGGNQSPTVSLTSPVNNASFNAPASITINANAADADGTISKVEFFNGSTPIGSDLISPYSFVWSNVAAGTYTITAKATDNLNAVTTSSAITVVVKTIVVNQPPTVIITSPANNTSVNAPASITINANATDADGTISKVEFYNGSTQIGSDASAPYSYVWNNVAAGTYTITAKVTDNSNAVTTSASVTITVKTVNTNTCSGIAQYTENGGYVAGSKVQNAGNSYQCKPYPYTGWCNGGSWAYAPGTGLYWSDAWTIIGPCTSAIIPSAYANTSAFSPNPASDVITLNLNVNSKVTIYNSMGYAVISQVIVFPNGTLNISSLPAGLYEIIIETGSEVITQTVVKN